MLLYSNKLEKLIGKLTFGYEFLNFMELNDWKTIEKFLEKKEYKIFGKTNLEKIIYSYFWDELVEDIESANLKEDTIEKVKTLFIKIMEKYNNKRLPLPFYKALGEFLIFTEDENFLKEIEKYLPRAFKIEAFKVGIALRYREKSLETIEKRSNKKISKKLISLVEKLIKKTKSKRLICEYATDLILHDNSIFLLYSIISSRVNLFEIREVAQGIVSYYLIKTKNKCPLEIIKTVISKSIRYINEKLKEGNTEKIKDELEKMREFSTVFYK